MIAKCIFEFTNTFHMLFSQRIWWIYHLPGDWRYPLLFSIYIGRDIWDIFVSLNMHFNPSSNSCLLLHLNFSVSGYLQLIVVS